MTVFKGEDAEYTLTTAIPFAFGRSSLLFEASDSAGSHVALKVFRTSPSGGNTTQFFNEVRAHRFLDHPNILPILDFGLAPEARFHGPFLVLPFCDGGNLRLMMQQKDFFPVRVCLPILHSIAAAIDHAHDNGVIHGDVKPENILFASSVAKLADFGVAKYFPIKERVTTVIPSDETGGAGSSAYMSPEQIEDGIQSPRSDIYSLAVIAFELLTGSLPFDVRLTPYRQMAAKIAGKLLNPASLNPRLSRIACNGVMAGLDVDRNKRPSCARAFVDTLGGVPEPDAVSPPRTPTGRVFISYSHGDVRWLRRLETVLAPLLRENRFTVWSDRQIEAGSHWQKDIEEALSAASVAVLLVSHNFLASRFINEHELPRLLDAAQRNGVKILWIAVSASLYKSSPLAQFQAANDPDRPLDSLSGPALNRQFVKIAEVILSHVTPA